MEIYGWKVYFYEFSFNEVLDDIKNKYRSNYYYLEECMKNIASDFSWFEITNAKKNPSFKINKRYIALLLPKNIPENKIPLRFQVANKKKRKFAHRIKILEDDNTDSAFLYEVDFIEYSPSENSYICFNMITPGISKYLGKLDLCIIPRTIYPSSQERVKVFATINVKHKYNWLDMKMQRTILKESINCFNNFFMKKINFLK